MPEEVTKLMEDAFPSNQLDGLDGQTVISEETLHEEYKVLNVWNVTGESGAVLAFSGMESMGILFNGVAYPCQAGSPQFNDRTGTTKPLNSLNGRADPSWSNFGSPQPVKSGSISCESLGSLQPCLFNDSVVSLIMTLDMDQH